MDKLNMHTPDKSDENFRKLAELFPNAVTETIDLKTGETVRAIDKDVLMQEISASVVEGKDERYRFTWPDKNKSVLLANSPTSNTLRPCREESVDFDNTENLYIEGDNLEALKLLRETYLGKIKMIYIDPPYNTGNDFVYNDNFTESVAEYLAHSGQSDDAGNRLSQNTESNGRFHTNWLNMIYPRLKLAKDLLKDDGAIFISIDDHEIKNLLKLCDEIFGEKNFIANIVWQKKYAATNDAKGFSTTHDYIVVYARNIDSFDRNLLPRTAEQNAPYKNDDGDGKGLWRSDNLLVKSFSQSGVYPIVNPNTGKEYYPPEGSCWRASKETMSVWLAENRIYFGKNGKGAPQLKRYLNEVQQGRVPITWWGFDEVGHNDAANKEVKTLFESKPPFDTPKPTTLIRQMLLIASKPDSIILDFFSGSATTAHAVMQLNAEENASRKFIMVQIPEPCSAGSSGSKQGYKNICEIGKERIRRAGAKIIHNSQCIMHNAECKMTKCENYALCVKNSALDVGFRVLKVDSTNMKDVYYDPADFQPNLLDSLADNIKEDRTPEDLLFQVMLDLGILLSSKISESEIGGKKVFNVEDNYLIACFDDAVTEEVITEIAKQKPHYFVMRDSSMASDSVAANFEQIFAAYSPGTIRKVL